MDGLWPPFPAHLEVKRSLIANAGDGLFAKRRIRKDKRIGKYRGVSYARKEASDTVEESHKPYLVSLGDGSFRDGYQMNNHMRWANHKSHVEGRDVDDPNEPNAWLRLMEDKVVYVEALRDIEEGEEIYIDYGYDPVIPEEEEEMPNILMMKCESCGKSFRHSYDHPWCRICFRELCHVCNSLASFISECMEGCEAIRCVRCWDGKEKHPHGEGLTKL